MNRFESLFGTVSRFGAKKALEGSKEFFSKPLHIFGVFVLVLVIILGFLYFFNVDFKNKIQTTMVPMLEGFSAMKTKQATIDQLDVLLFYSKTCPWCQKMLDVLKADNTLQYVQLVDINSEEGSAVVKQYNLESQAKQGVPAFLSLKMKTMAIGFQPTTSDVVAALMKANGSVIQMEPSELGPRAPQHHQLVEGSEGSEGMSEGISEVADLDIYLFKTSTCGHCKKALEMLSELSAQYGQLPITVMDLKDADGRSAFEETGIPQGTGVPIYWSKKTGKHIVGNQPFNKVVVGLTAQTPNNQLGV